MLKQQMRSRSLVTAAKLAGVVVVSCSFALTTYLIANNTSSLSKTETTVLVSEAKVPVVSDGVQVTVPQKVHVVMAEAPTRFDKAIDVLAATDAHLYRQAFAAQKAGDWVRADAAMAALGDRRLVPALLADRYEHLGATPAELAAWLSDNADWAEAETLHDLARRTLKTVSKKETGATPVVLKEPTTPDTWTGGAVMDSAADFRVDLKAAAAGDTGMARLAQAIGRSLRRGDPQKAAALLIKAQGERTLAGTFAADAEAAIASGFFYQGERDKALALSQAAAGAQQPVGLWIRGLIAWEKDDLPTAVSAFGRLAEHPALSPASRAAAQFWAWRAMNRSGDVRGGRQMLEAAARQTGSFYGILAATKLGRHPITQATNPNTMPRWDREHRAVLVGSAAGWRALALVQVGEVARAEEELRHLNPQGKGDLQQAMVALASFVPMPSLVIQLASLTGSGDVTAFDDVSYPLPPWKPRHGFTIDRALVYALIRHESQFDPKAVSAQGARGLMQILPSTARAVAEGNVSGTLEKVAFNVDDARLLDPATNLSLGQRYVRHLAEQPVIGDNLMLLLAAYNGGPSKLSRWVADTKARLHTAQANDPLLFLESIPLRETRGYITRVMTHYWAYSARLGKPLTSLRQLTAGEWPRFDLSDTPVRREEADAADPLQVAALDAIR